MLGIVRDEKLFAWKPDPVDGNAPDWGEAGFALSASRSHAPTWIKPLNNDAPPNALFKAMADLARAKLPDVRLRYLT